MKQITDYERQRSIPLIILTGIGLTIACAACLWILFGTPGYSSQAEATGLSASEITELVGTTAYRASAGARAPSVFSALSQVFSLPFVDPLQMLTSEFPATQMSTASAASTSSAQSSLFAATPAPLSVAHKEITLGWLQTDNVTQEIRTVTENPGVNVVSPEWLSLAQADGSVQNAAQPTFVAWAQRQKIQLWPMFTNQFNAAVTHAFLANPTAQANTIRTLQSLAVAQHFAGINLDFENIPLGDQTAYTQFVAQLQRALSSKRVILSVDVTPDIVPLEDNTVYFHAGLAAVADYVVLMAYDEHWAGDTVPGPVADMPWVQSSVNDLLDTGVPNDKLILGVPFYARFWHVYADGSVSSEAVADAAVAGILSSHHAVGRWQPQLGLFYARYPKANGYEEVWYPGPATWTQTLTIVQRDGLAGVAAWSLALSDPHTWSSIVAALREAVV